MKNGFNKEIEKYITIGEVAKCLAADIRNNGGPKDKREDETLNILIAIDVVSKRLTDILSQNEESPLRQHEETKWKN